MDTTLTQPINTQDQLDQLALTLLIGQDTVAHHIVSLITQRMGNQIARLTALTQGWNQVTRELNPRPVEATLVITLLLKPDHYQRFEDAEQKSHYIALRREISSSFASIVDVATTFVRPNLLIITVILDPTENRPWGY